jgi:hypothetical protein
MTEAGALPGRKPGRRTSLEILPATRLISAVHHVRWDLDGKRLLGIADVGELCLHQAKV